DVRAEGVQQVDVRAGDPGVQHVTDDRDVDAVEVVAACCGVVPAADEVAANGERVEQRLGRVLVSAVPGVDDPRVDPPRGGEAFGRPGGAVADDDGVGAHRLQGLGGVLQGFALGDRGSLDGEVDDVRRQPLGRRFEGDPGAGGVLEEQVDDRLAAER